MGVEEEESQKQQTVDENASREELTVIEQQERFMKKKITFLTAISGALIFFLLLGMTLGSVFIPLEEIIAVIMGEGEIVQETIIWRIRFPRVVAAAIAGACLSVSGAVMQSILRNPLGSPFTLGISHAAAFGAGFAVVVLGAGTMHSTYGSAVIVNNPYIITISAFVFCVLATLIILFISKLQDGNPLTMLLMGMVLGSLFAAGSTAIQYFANDVQLAAIVFWTFGNLGRATWGQVLLIACIGIPGILYFYKNAWNYSIIDSGDEVAQSLGVNISRIRIIGMLVASLMTAAVISFFGIIAYVGLVVPHIIRRLLGNQEKILIIGSTLFGALFLLISDTIARTILSPVILPVGVLTSFLGAPLFIYLLMRNSKKI